MSPYVAGGYLAALGTLGTYALTLVRREQLARRRLQAAQRQPADAASPPPPAP